MSASGIKKWMNTALGFVYPNVCQICGGERATPAEGFVCARCWQQVRFIKPPFCKRCGLPFQGELTAAFECANCREMKLHFRSARSAVSASGTVLDVIHHYKYRRALWFEPFLADLLMREALPELRKEKWGWIVPVPLHPAKQRQREFNQAERLATYLSAASGIPLDTGLLKRVTATLTQTKLTREQRANNMRGAFRLRDRRKKLKGQRILLFDDVFTTGATTDACAKVLLAAGAEEVCVWTVARGL